MPKIVKITTVLNPLDLLAPHSCRGCGRLGKPLCDCCKNYIVTNRKKLRPNCSTKNLPPIFIIGRREELIGKLIYDFKFSSVRALAKPLAELLDAILPQTPTNTEIIPLPTISKHIRARGFDHTLLLAKKLAKLRHHKITKILLRDKNTVQVGADKKTRAIQAKSAYQLNPNLKINPNTTYILLDDIWTTGSSIKAAIKKLQTAGVKKIIIAILAVSSLD
ncbi:ComF family protein [Candidatus Saccharibacteria bacterium]|nr:ComF family protein [Candidatus Saccharibacteria bacterium]